ncbi:arginine metabolism regulation protein II [Colletotrichum asianum]
MQLDSMHPTVSAKQPDAVPSSFESTQPKTFTGCWTCRGRKVKCDEIRPHCRECRARNLKCEGYGARLQWLSPDTGVPTRKGSLGPEEAGFPSRRELPLCRWSMPELNS